jgi:hypothetical protein
MVRAVTEAVANERRDLLPTIAGLEEEIKLWKEVANEKAFWKDHGLTVAGISLVVGSIITSILFSTIPE